MVFGIRLEDDEVFNAYQRKFTIREILNRLAAGGMETRMYYNAQRDEICCKVRCPVERLQKEAGRIGYKLLLDSSVLRSTCQHGRPGRWSGLVIQDEHNQCRYEPYEHLHAPYLSDRPDMESLYKRYGDAAGAGSAPKIVFRGVDRLKLMYTIMVAKSSEGGCNLDIVKLLKYKAILGFFPLHDKVELRLLQRAWFRYVQAPWAQPIQDVKDYYGEKIGLYFLWLGHYTTWLLPASICGILAWINVAAAGNDPNVPGTAAFSVFVALWCTMFTEFWRRRQATYTMRWGMTGFEQEEQTRPQFKGTRSTNPVDGRPIDYFPRSEATKRFVFSATVITALVCVVIAAVASIFLLKEFLVAEPQHDRMQVAGVDLTTIIPSLCNAVQIQIMNAIYGSVAIWLNDLENHRTDTAYEDNLIAKTFMFQFVNSYASLVWIAFIKPRDKCVDTCMNELATNLGAIFLTRLAVGNLTQVLLPLLKARALQRRSAAALDPERMPSIAEKEYVLEIYDVMLGPFNDYAEMAIQFGYATLFVAAYPLSCLMAFINNYIAIRVDAWKLLQVCRRPEPRGAEDIGTWHTILEIMGVISVVSNSALIAFTSDLFAGHSTAQRIWIFMLFEHGVMLFKYALAVLIPDVPQDVTIQLEREEFVLAKVLHNEPDDDDDPPVKEDGALLSDRTIRQEDDDW
ncbi:calcium-activated chloride channel-domain-containing protein [Tribonema minus]|uniref:Calcium-activated chloride channel-domain-containing protein n=1 Tax=Tribonema minus TaxID=303371 RepID=A0A835ZD27_9STRA|nr:calcium-activated chloride channel-domain-containing protein [Tribonema minus]